MVPAKNPRGNSRWWKCDGLLKTAIVWFTGGVGGYILVSGSGVSRVKIIALTVLFGTIPFMTRCDCGFIVGVKTVLVVPLIIISGLVP